MRPPVARQRGRPLRPDDAGPVSRAFVSGFLYALLCSFPDSAAAQGRAVPAPGDVGCVRLTGRDVAEALEGRLPGLDVLRTSGQAGAGARLHLRGHNSMFRSNQPLVFMDGVRISRPTEGGPSMLDLLHPQDVVRIDVLRGPAATALYGTDASSGVVLIYTRRGRADTAAVGQVCG